MARNEDLRRNQKLSVGYQRSYNSLATVGPQYNLVRGESGDMADAVDDDLVPSPGSGQAFPRHTWSDIILCGVTLAELSLLALMTPTFTVLDWSYVLPARDCFWRRTHPAPSQSAGLFLACHHGLSRVLCLPLCANPLPRSRARLLCLAPAWAAPGGGRGGAEPGQSPHPWPVVRHPPRPCAAWPRQDRIGWCAIRSTSPISSRTSVSTVQSGMAAPSC